MYRQPKMLPMPYPDQQMHVSFLLDQSSFQTHEPSNSEAQRAAEVWPGILQGSVHPVQACGTAWKAKHSDKAPKQIN